MITKENFYQILNKILSRVMTSKPGGSIHIDETFSDYGLDSLDQMNMLLEIEGEIGVSIDDVDTKRYDTPAKLYDFIMILPHQ